jgi:autotransporter-associated beta strand protein
VGGSFGGGTDFFNTSTAGTGTFIADGGHASNASGGGIIFFDSSSASTATFVIDGGTVNGATGGHVEFAHTSTAARATLTANGGTNGGGGGTIFFLDDSTGGQANVILSGNGTLNLSSHSAPEITVGTLQGDGGLVVLGSSKIRVNNRRDITFGGVISGNGAVAKGAGGKLDLTNANTYTGGTKITDGTLLIDNVAGSGTGPGPVRVKSGALGGNGTIAGAVMIGAGIPGNGAFLTPGASFGNPGTFTILGPLSFNSDGFFNVGFRNAVVGQVIANGVTINSEAQFAFFNNHGVTFPVGTVLIVLSNTAGTPIFGEFENLPDGLVFTSEGNTFQVSYQGGDGNDLALTRIP